MIKLLGYITSFFLVSIIFLRLPENNVGLNSFGTQNSFFGSPKAARQNLNVLTGLAILIYFGIAITLNIY